MLLLDVKVSSMRKIKLFHIFEYISSIKDGCFSELYVYGEISIKINRNEEISYISIFKRSVFICSFMFYKDYKKYSFKGSTTNIKIDYEDIDEDESYLILKYGRIVSSDFILTELETTIEYLHSFVSDAIIQYNECVG